VLRTYVVTGSASGIGKATRDLLEGQGNRVIGVDMAGAEVIVNLAGQQGRERLVTDVAAIAGDSVDAVIACAGIGRDVSGAVRVNYFGAVATVEGLRPLLARGTEPRAVVVSSATSIGAVSTDIVNACLDGDEPAAAAAAKAVRGKGLVYPSTKAALARWVRRTAISPEWAAAGIPLNAVAPALIVTPMTAGLLADDQMCAALDDALPMPLGGHGRPDQVAELLVWLAGPQNSMVTGQVVFIDGGCDATLRGDSVW
jgi:NAD(P)-dependent dehydrogenase (short-subunit alcohol dehydrogenase family)